MIKELLKNIRENSKLWQELQALPAIIAYPDYYQLGKESVHYSCKWCGDRADTRHELEFMKSKGLCFECFEEYEDDMRSEYFQDAKDMAESEMMSIGLNPDNIDDVQIYMDIDRDN